MRLRLEDLDLDLDLRLLILAFLALRLRGLLEAALFLLRETPTMPRPPQPCKFLIMFCADADTRFDRMSRTFVFEGLSAMSAAIFAPARNASRPMDEALLHSMGRTVLHRPRRKLPRPWPL